MPTVCWLMQIKVKRRGDDQKFIARVLALGVDCDMALLTVDSDAFWEGVEPLEFGPLPKLQDTVAVVGYPIGGDTISVTVGVVSRIEVSMKLVAASMQCCWPCQQQQMTVFSASSAAHAGLVLYIQPTQRLVSCRVYCKVVARCLEP